MNKTAKFFTLAFALSTSNINASTTSNDCVDCTVYEANIPLIDSSAIYGTSSVLTKLLATINGGLEEPSKDKEDPEIIYKYLATQTVMIRDREYSNDESKKAKDAEIKQLITVAKRITSDSRLTTEKKADTWMNISILHKILGARHNGIQDGKDAFEALNKAVDMTPTRPKSVYFYAVAIIAFKELPWAKRTLICKTLGIDLDASVKKGIKLLKALPQSPERDQYLKDIK